MTLSLHNLTFIIVTFKSEHIIHECIESLPKNSKIIIIENSNDETFKQNLLNKYPKIKIIVQKNSGMGSANNIGIRMCETDYAFVINPDVKFDSSAIQNLIDFTKRINDYSILSPISDDIKHPNYIIKDRNIDSNERDHIVVDSVDGFAMLINKNKFKDDVYFDENFFLYLENEDLCIRKKKEKENIYVLKTAKINHLGGKSHSIIYEREIEYSRNWHWMWSKFYFNLKYYGYLIAFLRTLPSMISSIIKILFYFLTFNSYKKKIYLMRFLGLYNSMMGKSSWYRPKI